MESADSVFFARAFKCRFGMLNERMKNKNITEIVTDTSVIEPVEMTI